MSQLPAVHYDQNIKYDVPYVFMDDANDCWEAALRMMLKFNKAELKDDRLSHEGRRFGVNDQQLAEILSPYLNRHNETFNTETRVYEFLREHGPAVLVLNEGVMINHVQVLTGRWRGTVFLNNPDNDFSKADLSASGPFNLIETSIKHRYGGLSFQEWRDWIADQVSDEATPIAAYGLSPADSPISSGRASPVAPRSRPGSPQLSPRVSPPGSPVATSPLRFGSPPGSPRLSPRGGSPNGSGASTPTQGPANPGFDVLELRRMLERQLPNSGREEKLRYIADMEEQILFRQHRPMPFQTFRELLMVDSGVWTLKDW
ncbi:papain-like cysteine protease family protein [Caulobacter sp. 1776]|uniref:papain-like cysteine protease family protein n=1 Tax=Caulobacter sp. 1776 TaxID=3156420 RepID=UPI0033940616